MQGHRKPRAYTRGLRKQDRRYHGHYHSFTYYRQIRDANQSITCVFVLGRTSVYLKETLPKHKQTCKLHTHMAVGRKLKPQRCLANVLTSNAPCQFLYIVLYSAFLIPKVTLGLQKTNKYNMIYNLKKKTESWSIGFTKWVQTHCWTEHWTVQNYRNHSEWS